MESKNPLEFSPLRLYGLHDWHVRDRGSTVTPSHSRKATELDAKAIQVHFSPRLTQAFRDLAAAVHFSEHFDNGTLRTVQDFAEGKSTSLHGVMISLPVLATETFKHIEATGDDRAREAWEDISAQMSEKGFTLTRIRTREK